MGCDELVVTGTTSTDGKRVLGAPARGFTDLTGWSAEANDDKAIRLTLPQDGSLSNKVWGVW